MKMTDLEQLRAELELVSRQNQRLDAENRRMRKRIRELETNLRVFNKFERMSAEKGGNA